tara:strand:- start:109 stop:330 length:222 start_codon:yes stop_codon:yes gene_type:complete
MVEPLTEEELELLADLQSRSRASAKPGVAPGAVMRMDGMGAGPKQTGVKSKMGGTPISSVMPGVVDKISKGQL